jgi:hypothetical protein
LKGSLMRGTHITSVEELRGPFTVYDGWLVLPVLVVGMGLARVALRTLGETSRPADHPLAWTVALLIALAVIGVPFVIIALRVHAFQIDDNAQLWVRRWGRYEPLDIAEFAQVRAYVKRLPRGGFVYKRLVFSGGKSQLRRIALPLGHIVSRRHRTLVDGALVNALILDQCHKAGFAVQSLGDDGKQGWVATRP